MTAKHRSPIASLLFGLSIPAQAALTIVRSPVLLFWSLLPAGITLALYLWVLVALNKAIQGVLVSQIVNWGMDPTGWLAWSLLFVSKLALFLVAAVTFSTLAVVVSAPFNDFLAEQAETRVTPSLVPVPSPNLLGRFRLIRIDLFKTMAAGMASFLAIFLSWIPLLNFLVLGLTFFVITFQFISFPQTRRGEDFRQGIRFVLEHPFACIGFGAVFALLFAIPFVAAATLPLAVVGGTLLYARGPTLR